MYTDKSKLFSFRPGEQLLDKFEKVKLALGLSSSDVAREALDYGLETLLQRQQQEIDIREFTELEREPKKTLLSLLKKESTGLGLTRAEWKFLAFYVNKTYDYLSHTIEFIDRDLLIANLLAFAAVIKLRDSQYPSDDVKKDDAYYLGNMGFSYVNCKETGADIQTHVTAVVAGLPEHPNTGLAVFATRNLDAALRDEPPLDIRQLNAALRPYLKSLLLVAIRGYWHRSEYVPVIKNDEGYRSYISVDNISNEHFSIGTSAHEGSISCAMEFERHNCVFTLNNYVEITDFYALLNSMGPNCTHAKVPEFTLDNVEYLNKNSPRADRYMLGTRRWRHFFNHAEFESLKSLMNDYFHDAVVKKHMHTLEAVYGKI